MLSKKLFTLNGTFQTINKPNKSSWMQMRALKRSQSLSNCTKPLKNYKNLKSEPSDLLWEAKTFIKTAKNVGKTFSR